MKIELERLMWKHILNSQEFSKRKGNEKKINSTDCCKCNQKRISYKERMEDALVHGAEEGRDKLRKAAVSCK